jgi:Pentapeptide repeats (8 copies)
MRPMAEVFIPVLLIGCLVAAVAVAGEQEGAVALCGGPYANRTPTPEEFATVLRNHQVWLEAKGEPNDVRRANLCGARLINAHIQKALLAGAHLQEAILVKANLQGARLHRAHLQEADLSEGNLQEADLWKADLRGALLINANLQEAFLGSKTNLQEADLAGANLRGTVYEPDPGKLPMFAALTDPRNHLDTLVFHTSPAALIALREAFKKGGMRTQERQLTYAIEHTKRLEAWGPSWYNPREEDTRTWLEKLAGKSESLFSYVLFELPSGYGLAPSRALATLGLLILGFSLIYMVALMAARGRAGIWVTWPTDRVYQEEGAKEATRVTTTFFFPRLQARAAGHWWGVLLRGVSVPLIGLYFSLLSAFSLGWRELNVGTWIARVQPREYVLRATGWVRTVSGLQSLLSVYLLALWVLTYFGRPFE